VVLPGYEVDDPWADWLSREIVTHPDGLWLADGTDRQPLDTWVSLTVAGESSVDLTTDPAALQALLGIDDAVGDWLTVDGSWHSNEGVEVRVMSALAPRSKSAALAKSVAASGPFEAYLPQLQAYDDGGTKLKRDGLYLPWIVRKENYPRLDKTDALGSDGAMQRSRLNQNAAAFGKLRPADPFDRNWEDTAGETVLRAEAWIESARHEESASAGSRLWCRTDVARAYLEAQRADLLWLVRLRRRDGGHSSQPTRYWHTTAVIRMNSSLKLSYYPGRANELDESKY
jgi:hypothetical protein